mgnify:CR=1 FL=1
MINIIWMVLLVGGITIGVLTGNTQAVTDALMSNAETGVELAMGLIGMMALWLGLMKIAEEAGLVKLIGNAAYNEVFIPRGSKRPPCYGIYGYEYSSKHIRTW